VSRMNVVRDGASIELTTPPQADILLRTGDQLRLECSTQVEIMLAAFPLE
jgi:hypothetical protein